MDTCATNIGWSSFAVHSENNCRY